MRALLAVLFVCAPIAAHAHQPSESFLIVSAPEVSGDAMSVEARWDVALRDLDRALELDADRDGTVTPAEVESASARIVQWASAGQTFATTGACAGTMTLSGLATRGDGPYAALQWAGSCPLGASLSPTHTGLFAADPTHRVLARLGEASVVLHRERTTGALPIGTPPDGFDTFTTYVGQGVLHIWEGIDHILFLLALLLPAVLRWRNEHDRPAGWVPHDRLKTVLVEVAKVVTAFTLAHSITLVLGTLGIVTMPSAVVETAIAVSVALAALNNLSPVVDARWTVAFGLGLLHGFGFSSVLMELGLPDGARALALAGFNIGVELGQLAIVLAVVPLAFLARKTPAYRIAILTAGSIIIAGVAIYWSLERSVLA